MGVRSPGVISSRCCRHCHRRSRRDHRRRHGGRHRRGCESLRGEMNASGVKVVTLCPGYVDTPLTQGNRYAMPFLLQPAEFADRAFRAIQGGTSYRVIPWQMGVVAKLLRLLPNPLFDRLFQGRGRKRRQGQ